MGKRTRKMRPAMERFESHFTPEPNSGCWLWFGAANKKGYGNFFFEDKFYRAHRWIYEQINGPVSATLDMCHKCDNPSCVNPDHLFPGTRSDNMQDSIRKGRVRRNERKDSNGKWARKSENDN